MLVKITKEKAFELLMNEDTSKTVFFKRKSGEYIKAIDYVWSFHKDSQGVIFESAEFYEEVEEDLNDKY